MKIITVILLNALLLMLCSCGVNDENGSQSFSYDLQGTWETTNYKYGDSLYATMKITYNTITINGYIANFPNFTQDARLDAYSQDSLIYVKHIGDWQPPVAYRLWDEGGSYPRTKFLTLRTVKDETFKPVEEDTCEEYYYNCY